MQKIIWGFSDLDLLPPRLFVVAHKIGGQVFGAFDGQRMVGFCVAIPGIRAGGVYYLHSHMMGVIEEYQNRGIGRALKLAQRKEALERGIELVEWTFDPLEIKNSHFNIARLGAIVRRFVPNQYGISSSPLHGGLPTDRCVAEWWIGSPQVRALLDEQRPLPVLIEGRIEVPQEIGELKKTNPGQAREMQARIREEFEYWLSKGLAAVGYEITPQAGAFLIGPEPAHS
ncbi:MAG: GNAT family N-acetyltransferase [Acidobacteria bacterium]|nr:GNAT family N-acetyltransferase [Acidobacteriota bacterium]